MYSGLQGRQKFIKKFLNIKKENPPGRHKCKWENIIKMSPQNRRGDNVFRITRETETHSKILEFKTENPPGRHKCKWENIIKMSPKNTRGNNVLTINLALGSVQWLDFANTAMNNLIP